MMLAFALVPLVAGIILVLVTGMWFFLLFSCASAIIALSIFIHGQAQRRRYRRARRTAASLWAEHTKKILVSPGQTAQSLRADGTAHASAATETYPAVRLGEGVVEAALEQETSDKERQAEQVWTAVGIGLRPGEITLLRGPSREQQRLRRWILLQLILNPMNCDIALYAHDVGFETTGLRDIGRCYAVNAEELSQMGQPSSESGILVATELVKPSEIERVLRSGWHVIIPDSKTQQFSGSTGWRIDLSQQKVEFCSGPAVTTHYAHSLCMDGLSETTLGELCRLAIPQSVVDVGPGELPRQASSTLTADLFSAGASTELLAEVGVSTRGKELLDLVGDGPHILVAGTTGSGKSELLKTMLLSLCASYSPLELTMVLVDFKGGAAFQRLEKLEHVLGVVTDLSQAAAERTLESIRSELVRRERLFLDADASDYIEYRMLSSKPLPRMLVVIDEFRIFSHELPDQLDELMRLATLGRSLGLHLVLSTQRPQGAVTADIRANIGASVALRTRGDDESRDVIGTPAAATIPRTIPGRAMLRRPGDTPIELQTTLLQATEPDLCASAEISPVELAAPTPNNDVSRALMHQLHERGLQRAHTPLLAPLPQSLHPHQSVEDHAGALLGRIDDPANQNQSDLAVNPLHPQSLALIGEASAGAHLACAALTAQLLQKPAASALYLFDGDRSLPEFKTDRRVGAWLTEDHIREAAHLLDRLCEELAARRMGRGTSELPLVVIMTGFSRWVAQSQSGLTMEHQLGTLIAEGSQAGISVIMAGGRELSVGKLAGRFPQRIFLPYGSGEDVTYLWPKLRSTDPLPGRGVLISSTIGSPGLTVQLVNQNPVTDHRPPSAALQEAEPPTIRVHPLPEQLTVEELPTVHNAGVVVGLQQLSWAPASLQLGPVNLILGSPGTGKTSCLELLAHQIPDAALFTPGDNPLNAVPDVLLVDDAHLCSVEEHQGIQQALSAGACVVATAPASTAVFQQLPWAHPARTQGANVILSPLNRSEAEAFAAVIPTLDHPTPGRAVHLRPEGAVFCQWALPPR